MINYGEMFNEFQAAPVQEKKFAIGCMADMYAEDIKAQKAAEKAQKKAEHLEFWDRNKALKNGLIIGASVIGVLVVVAGTAYVVKRIIESNGNGDAPVSEATADLIGGSIQF